MICTNLSSKVHICLARDLTMEIYLSILLWIRFCIWATELESGPSSSNTYPSSGLIRARSIVLDQFDFELDNHRAPVEILGTSNKWIRFCIWATELESGISSSNTYSSTRPNRARDVELDELDIELHNHRARHQFHGTSKRMTTSSSIT